MQKARLFLFACLLSLSMTWQVFAHEVATNPQTTEGTAFTVVPVYNNSASTVSAGDVVIWDIDASTGDNDLYVNTTTTADTHLVAGIVYPGDIATNVTGAIVIYGIVTVNTESAGDITTDTALCTSTTAGKVGSCAPNNSGEVKLGHALAAESGGTVAAFINP